MICPRCQSWIQPLFDRDAGEWRCPECGHTEPRHFFPLFIVTGPSGAGKTAVVPELQRLLPDWEVFETDILWDSGSDWMTVKANWLRIADSLAQRPHGRLTILCGTIQPAEVAQTGLEGYFGAIHWLALVCDEDTLERRLRARPAWRGSDGPFIAAQKRYLAQLQAGAGTTGPVVVLDTTHAPITRTASDIRDWAVRLAGIAV